MLGGFKIDRMIVHQQRSLSLVDAVRVRYIFGRLFGSGRVYKTVGIRRLVYACSAIILPLLLLTRIAGSILRKRRGGNAFFRALPALVLFSTAWSWGELVGTLTGRPEASLTPILGGTPAKSQN